MGFDHAASGSVCWAGTYALSAKHLTAYVQAQGLRARTIQYCNGPTTQSRAEPVGGDATCAGPTWMAPDLPGWQTFPVGLGGGQMGFCTRADSGRWLRTPQGRRLSNTAGPFCTMSCVPRLFTLAANNCACCKLSHSASCCTARPWPHAYPLQTITHGTPQQGRIATCPPHQPCPPRSRAEHVPLLCSAAPHD